MSPYLGEEEATVVDHAPREGVIRRQEQLVAELFHLSPHKTSSMDGEQHNESSKTCFNFFGEQHRPRYLECYSEGQKSSLLGGGLPVNSRLP